MSSFKFKRAGAVALGVAVCAFFAMQGCGSDTPQATPPAAGAAGAGTSGSAGAGTSGSAGAGTSGSAGAGTSGSAGAGTSGSAGAGTSGSAGAGTGGDCGDATKCYTCAPSTNDQFHNHCGTGACDCASPATPMCPQRFDNAPLNLPSTGLPPLVPPTTPT